MRKLAIASFSFAVTVLMCHYIIPNELRLWIVVPLTLIIAASFAFRSKIRTRILLLCIFSVIGVLRYDFHAKEYLDIEKDLHKTDYRITAYVAEYPVLYDDYSKVTVHLRSDLLPCVKAVFYDYDHRAENLKPGDMIRTTVRFTSATVSAGEETDTYISKGIYLRGTIRDEIKQYDTPWGKLLFAPLYVAREIQNVFDEYTSQRAAVFMKALVTGEKNSLYAHPEINRILQKAGLSHVVAVSGMHVSFLVGMLMMLLGNRRGWIASVLSLGIFALMTGMSPSVLRAAFMQLLYLLAPVIRRESDGITSIAFALLVLLMVNPFAIASISLQLSFSAVLGIVLLTPRVLDWFNDKGQRLNGLLQKGYFAIATSLSATLGASVFTVPLCAIYFGNVTLLAPLSNLFVLWIVPICFMLGFLLCVISLISGQLAAIIGSLLSLMVEFVYMIAATVSNVPYANVYLPTRVMLFWIICVYVVFGVTYLIRRERFYRPLIPACFAVISLFALLLGIKGYYSFGTTVAAIDVGQGQCIVMMNDDETVLIDCGGAYDSGQSAVNWLAERGREDVDCLIITHFDHDHINGLSDLMSQIPVKEILFCSLNLSEYEYNLLHGIQEIAAKNHVSMTHVNRSQKKILDRIDLNIYVPYHPKDNNGLMVLASCGAFDMLATGDADMETEYEMMRLLHIPDGECIVAGHHGSKYSTSEELLDRFTPEYAFVSCGYNQYGHPTQEVLDRLEQRNVLIYRTDTTGSIEIKVR